MAREMEYSDHSSDETKIKLKDLEEKQRVLKDRVLLVGQNLIDMKEKMNETILEIKKDLDKVKESAEKMKSFIESFSGELSRFAKKDDLNILAKQMRMFEPLRYLKEK